MSRAFISDSDGDFMEDDVPEAKYPLPEGVKNYMTPEGADRLRKERSSLADVERPALVARLAQNVTGEGGTEKERVLGDRRRLREIDRRIAYLTKLLERLEVVDPESQDQTRVLFGARVTVLENGHTEKSYRIVGVEESDPSSGDISFLSPIARTLTSKKVGDSVTLRIPAGEVNLKVVRIEY
jgi:transcription elongation factor GreB